MSRAHTRKLLLAPPLLPPPPDAARLRVPSGASADNARAALATSQREANDFVPYATRDCISSLRKTAAPLPRELARCGPNFRVTRAAGEGTGI